MKRITQYITNDGMAFLDARDASEHERLILLEQAVATWLHRYCPEADTDGSILGFDHRDAIQALVKHGHELIPAFLGQYPGVPARKNRRKLPKAAPG